MSSPLRIGFIGAGGIADLQLRLLAKREDVAISAISDINPQTIERRQSAYPQATYFAQYEDMLANCELDAVSVCTPNKLHIGATLGALDAGCHVLVEKPMAMSLTEAKQMRDRAVAQSRKLVIGFQYRFDPRSQFLRQAYDDGQFGRVLYGRVQALRRRGIPNWGVFGQKALQGGGPMIDIGIHVLEMLHYTIGCPEPISASADMFTYIGNQPSDRINSPWSGWDYQTYDVEDLAIGRIRFAGGTVVHIESAFAAHIGERSVMNFSLMGERGGASWEPTVVHTDETGHMVDKTPAWLPDHSFEQVFKRKMDAFVDHVLYDAPTIAPATDGVMVQAMLDALYQSAEHNGREIDISLD